MKRAFLVLALCLALQSAFGQTADDSSNKTEPKAEPKAVKNLADLTDFCSNPTGGGSFDVTRKAAMDKWASDHGFQPISGPCKTKGQWVLTWSESAASTHEAVIEQSDTGALQVRPKKDPGTLLLSREPDTPSLEPTADVLYRAMAPNIEEGLNKFLESVEQARKQAEKAANAADQATAAKQASGEKRSKRQRPVRHEKQQVGALVPPAKQ